MQAPRDMEENHESAEKVYADDVEEEIHINENEDDIVIDGVGDVDFEEYDADEEDNEISVATDPKCVATFVEHKGPVFAIDISKNGDLVVSGGEDDVAYVWNMESAKPLFTCTGHKDSVTCAAFSHDSKMVATGDMSGIIQVWNIETKQRVWNFETGDLEWIEWHPVATVLLAGTQDGQCWMWQIPKDNCKIFESNGLATSCGKFMPDGKSAVVCYGDGTLKVLDLKSAEIRFGVRGRDAHSDGISDVSFSPDGSLVATASIDGTVKLISTSSGKVTTTFDCNAQSPDRGKGDSETERESVECVAFSPVLSLIATGCLNGVLHIWDYKSGSLRHACKHEQGVTKLLWDYQHGGTMIYTGCLDGVCRSWDARSGKLLSSFEGSVEHIYDIKLSTDGKRLVSASADGMVRVYRVSEEECDPQR